jgi:LuxR family maltose regulon positive regulatory protein
MLLTITRGLLCRGGVEQMRRDLEDADPVVDAGAGAGQAYVTCLFLSGVAHLLLGDGNGAEARFADAVELTDETRRAPIFSAIVGYQALLSVLRGDWRAAEALVEQGLSVMRRGHAESYLTSAVLFPVAARTALHRHDVGAARALLSEGQRLRPLLSHAIPWVAVESLLQMAEVSLGLGDPSAARRFLRDADAVLRRRPDLGSLGERTEDLRGRLGNRQAAGTGASALTSAELRVLPLLLTHLTLAGIADRLFLSRHTVKAQVSSMYQKLDVHSRDGVVARARELGLLEA